ncbi:MAG: hypothetical protein M3Z08_09455, partial [Chloroflexota bacterium]|nr:hypothetical protein [Chloroflexota bacterium]
ASYIVYKLCPYMVAGSDEPRRMVQIWYTINMTAGLTRGFSGGPAPAMSRRLRLDATRLVQPTHSWFPTNHYLAPSPPW